MQKIILIFIILLCIPLLQSCISITVTPTVRGDVVDEITQEPINGARLSWKEYPKHKTQTNGKGNYVFKEHAEWVFYPIFFPPPSVVGPHGDLIIKKDGYLEKVIHVSTEFGEREVELQIELRKEDE